MSAWYDLFVTPVRKAESGLAPKLHARVVKGKTVSTSTLVDQIADASTFNRGELAGMLSAVSEAMARQLAEGNCVELEGIGFFSPSVKCQESKEETVIHAASVRFGTVRFRASTWLKEKMAGMRLLRKRKSAAIPERTAEEKRAMALLFLKTHSSMTRTEYERLTGCAKTRAIRDLNSWIENGLIRRFGKGTKVVYLAP
ncbi:MAG: HU family DNA-binding protein [Bacteroidales bacterium]|jgi:predicted histone-like DNA-binding protein|nr:HU family DNA-binding protein [Bacteroidales bacterium]MDD3161783.1 HU family DNA-binding protein [Bacteroidales bacterium]